MVPPPFSSPTFGSQEHRSTSLRRAMLDHNARVRRKPLVLTFVGLRQGAFRSALARAFPRARFLSGRSDPFPAATDLIIRVFRRGDSTGRAAFTREATHRQVASLGVECGSDGIFVGPLTLPGHRGCGYCGAERMRAAARALGVRQHHRPVHKLESALGEVLATTLRAVLRTGLKRSRVVDHVVVVDSQTGGRSRHRVVPLSNCPICGGVATARVETTLRLGAGTPLRRVVHALAGWVDRHTGVISAVIPERNIDEDARLPVVVTTAPPIITAEDGELRTLPVGWGKGLTVSGALLSGVGEAIERYAASLPDPDRVVWKRPDELRGAYLDPLTLPLYTNDQYRAKGFPCVRYKPRVRHPWVQGVWLGTDVKVWVPAILVFLSMAIESGQEFCQGTSSGLAAASDLDEAAFRATLELIERDALLASWLTSTPGRRIELDSTCDPRLLDIVEAIVSLGATVETYLLPAGVYGATVLCLALGDGKAYPGVTIGLGTGVDARAALWSAVLELGQTGPYLQRTMRSHTVPVPRAPASVRTMLDHAAYYFPSRRSRMFDRIRGTEAPVAMRDLSRTRPATPLRHCASALAASGIRVAIVDVTSADVATGPFRVARAVSPDLQPISFGYGMDRVPVARLRKMGISAPIPPIQPVW
jgi:ribosomal protein S12 methylthiotransferase accessory factor